MDSIIKKAYTLRAQRSKIPITTPPPPIFNKLLSTPLFCILQFIMGMYSIRIVPILSLYRCYAIHSPARRHS